MRRFASCLLLLALAPVAFGQGAALSRIAFGSCADQDKPLPIFDAIAAQKPQLLLMLGDNIYADLDKKRKVSPEIFREKYQTLASLPSWQRLRAAVPAIEAIWDDHDYGKNDGGAEWELKDEAKQQMLDFFGVPEDSARRGRAGAYGVTVYGPPGRRVQVILLDSRYFRTKLPRAPRPLPGTRIVPYLPATGPDDTLLGAEQWAWLERQLREPAEVRLLCSGIQVVSEEHPFEKWANFPKEREKLYQLIRDTKATGVVILSGDRHLGELSLEPSAVGYPLYDITASGLNQGFKEWRATEANAKRVSAMPYGDHFGMVTIDWERPDPLISLQLRDDGGEIVLRQTVPLAMLRPGTAGDAPAYRADAPPLPEGVIGAADALTKLGEAVTVQFEVRGAVLLGGGKRLLLNSERDFRSDKNFTVVLNEGGMTGPHAGPKAAAFTGKTIRAKGTVTEYKGAPQVQIDDAANLELVGR